MTSRNNNKVLNNQGKQEDAINIIDDDQKEVVDGQISKVFQTM